MYGPIGRVSAVEDAVMVTVAALLALNDPTAQVTPASAAATLQVKVTPAGVRPLIGVSVSIDVALLPGAMVSVVGAAPSEKSGPIVLKIKTLDHAAAPLLEEGSIAWTCQ
jgi:hypothetical protein